MKNYKNDHPLCAEPRAFFLAPVLATFSFHSADCHLLNIVVGNEQRAMEATAKHISLALKIHAEVLTSLC